MPGEQLDVSSEADWPSGARDRCGRQFLGVHFACCTVYSRLYTNRQATAYVGHCPRCGRAVRVEIGPGGTDARFFTVS